MLTAELRDNPLMGIALWLLSGAIAFLIARIVPFGRGAAKTGEFSASICAALLLGPVATAMDFGGWNEPDWRAALFAFLGAFTAAGLWRLVTGGGRPTPGAGDGAVRRRAMRTRSRQSPNA